MKETIVVRLASRGQYKVGRHPEDLLNELNEIDNQIVRLLSETEEKMHSLLVQMVERVIEQGEVIDDELIDSDLILPLPTLTWQKQPASSGARGSSLDRAMRILSLWRRLSRPAPLVLPMEVENVWRSWDLS